MAEGHNAASRCREARRKWLKRPDTVDSLVPKRRSSRNAILTPLEPVSAKLLPVRKTALNTFHAIGAKLLGLGGADLLPIDAVVANPLTLGGPDLLPLDAVGALGLLRTLSDPLLALDPRCTLKPLGSVRTLCDPLLALSALRTLNALGPLRALDPRCAFDTLRPFDLGCTLDALGPLRAFHSRCTLNALDLLRAFRSRGALLTLRPLWTFSALFLLDLSAIAIALGLCTGRGCDRQSSDTRGEKQPGHHKFSFRTAKTAHRPHRSTVFLLETAV